MCALCCDKQSSQLGSVLFPRAFQHAASAVGTIVAGGTWFPLEGGNHEATKDDPAASKSNPSAEPAPTTGSSSSTSGSGTSTSGGKDANNDGGRDKMPESNMNVKASSR
jgi:hypothetical protein